MIEDRHRDQAVARGQTDTAHTDRGTAGEDAHIINREADGAAAIGDQEDIIRLGAQAHGDNAVILFQLHRNLAIAIDLDEVGQAVAANRAAPRREHHIQLAPAVLVLRQRHDRGDGLTLVERQEIDHRLAARIRRAQGQTPGLGLVDHAAIGEEEQRRMGRGHEQGRDEILVLGRHARAALAAAALGPVIGQGGALGIAAMGDGDDHLFARDEILVLEIELAINEDGAARRAEILAHIGEFVANDLDHPVTRTQDIEQVGDLFGQGRGLIAQFVTAQTGQAVEAQFEDGAGLFLGQFQRPVRLQHRARIRDQADQRRHIMRRPGAGHQAFARRGRIRRRTDQGDDFIDIGDGERQTDDHMRAVARLGEVVLGPAGDDFFAEAQEFLEDIHDPEQLRAATHQGEHIGAETRLHRRPAIELVEDDIGIGIALELDDNAHAGAIGFIAQIGNTLDLLLAYKVGDLFDHRRLVHLEGDLVNDDRHAILAHFLDAGQRAHDDRTTPGRDRTAGTGAAENLGAGREIRTGNVLKQFLFAHQRIVEQGQRAIDHFDQIVRRNIGRHADGDTASPVDQKIGEAGRQNRRFAFLAVIVFAEINGGLVDIGQERAGGLVHAHFGITHRGRRIAIDRTEIALPVEQRQAHRPGLGHAHQRVVDGLIAMRVVFTDHITDDPRRLAIGLVRRVAILVHRPQNTAVHRLETVTRIRDGPAHDHAHRVIEIGGAHLVFDGNIANAFRQTGWRGQNIIVIAQGGPLSFASLPGENPAAQCKMPPCIEHTESVRESGGFPVINT